MEKRTFLCNYDINTSFTAAANFYTIIRESNSIATVDYLVIYYLPTLINPLFPLRGHLQLSAGCFLFVITFLIFLYVHTLLKLWDALKKKEKKKEKKSTRLKFN